MKFNLHLPHSIKAVFALLLILTSTTLAMSGQTYSPEKGVTYELYNLDNGHACVIALTKEYEKDSYTVPNKIYHDNTPYKVAGLRSDYATNLRSLIIEDGTETIGLSTPPSLKEIYLGRVPHTDDCFEGAAPSTIGIGPAVSDIASLNISTFSAVQNLYIADSDYDLNAHGVRFPNLKSLYIGRLVLAEQSSNSAQYTFGHPDICAVKSRIKGDYIVNLESADLIVCDADRWSESEIGFNTVRAGVSRMITPISNRATSISFKYWTSLNPGNIPADFKETTEVYITKDAKTINSYTFYGIKSLKKVVATAPTLTYIAPLSFTECLNLEVVEIGGNVTELGSNAFFDSHLKKVTLHPGPGSIKFGRYAFWQYRDPNFIETALQEVYIGRNIILTDFDSDNRPISPFSLAANLTKVTFDDNVTTIPACLFDGAYRLSVMNLPESLQTVGDCAFRACEKLTTLRFGPKVRSLGVNSFSACVGLTDIYVEAVTPPEMPYSCFVNTNSLITPKEIYENAHLHIPGGELDSYRATDWNYFVNISADIKKDAELRFLPDKVTLAIGASILETPWLKRATDAEPVYTSSDPSVAEVDPVNGGITLHKPGQTIITATVEETDRYLAASASYTLNVVAALKPTESITLTPSSLLMTIGESNTVSAKVEPYDANDSALSWSVSGSGISLTRLEGNAVEVKALETGSYRLTATCGNVSAVCDIIVVEEFTTTEITIDGVIYSFDTYSGTAEVIGAEEDVTEVIIKNMISVNGIDFDVVSIRERAFYPNKNVVKFVIPASVSTIESEAMSYCHNVRTLVIEDSDSELTVNHYALPMSRPLEVYIGRNLILENEDANPFFRSGITVLTVDGNATTFPDGMFYGSEMMTDARFGNNFRVASKYMMHECTSLKNLEFGESLSVVENVAFADCSALRNITIRSIVPPATGNGIFPNNVYTDATLYVPQASIADYKAHELWGLFLNIKPCDLNSSVGDASQLEEFSVYTIDGIMLYSHGNRADIDALPAGYYIINGKTHMIVK